MVLDESLFLKITTKKKTGFYAGHAITDNRVSMGGRG